MSRLVVTLCLAVLALLAVAVVWSQQDDPPPPARPVPAWRQPGPPRVTPPPGVSWCADKSTCDQTR